MAELNVKIVDLPIFKSLLSVMNGIMNDNRINESVKLEYKSKINKIVSEGLENE